MRIPTQCRHRVYPRVCGGTSRHRRGKHGSHGLSPRVRGNRVPLAGTQARGRSIPACAGEPEIRFTIVQAIKVYPRVCGGTVDLHDTAIVDAGLSPRVRGNRRSPWAYAPG